MYIDLFAGLDTPKNLLDGSNARTKMSKCKNMEKGDSSDEDDDFVTPGENFGESGRFVDKRCSTEKKRLKLMRELAIIENEYNAIVEIGGKSEKVRIMSMEDDVRIM